MSQQHAPRVWRFRSWDLGGRRRAPVAHGCKPLRRRGEGRAMGACQRRECSTACTPFGQLKRLPDHAAMQQNGQGAPWVLFGIEWG